MSERIPSIVLKQNSSDNAYKKGLNMYQQGFVKGLDMRETNQKIEVRAAVISSTNDRIYDVCLEYDKKQKKVTNTSCDCMAFFEYSGLCKHCVAIGVAVNKIGQPVKQSAAAKKEAPVTSKALEQFLYGKPKKLLQEYQIQNQPISQKTVNLLPILSCGYQDQWSVSFRIGTAAHYYVLKNLADFVTAVENAEVVNYGKNYHLYIHAVLLLQKAGLWWNLL